MPITLEESQREAQRLRELFNTPKKNEIRKFLYERYIDPSTGCEEPVLSCSILDLWGGGLFSDYILNQHFDVKNQVCLVLYEIEKSERLHPALKEYVREKSYPLVFPFYGSLARFVAQHRTSVQNQKALDFIWLDYCDTINGKDKDIEAISHLSDSNTTIALTIFRGRDGVINPEGRKVVIDSYIEKYLPLHKLVKSFEYKEIGGNMGTYVYRVPNKLKTLFKRTRLLM